MVKDLNLLKFSIHVVPKKHFFKIFKKILKKCFFVTDKQMIVRNVYFKIMFSNNSEASASELLENLEIFTRYYMHRDAVSNL